MLTYGLALLISLVIPPSAETGTLKVQAQPGTEVVWDGVSLDKIDASGTFTISEIPAGRFQVGLRKPGFQREERPVTITAGQTSILSVKLKPLPATRLKPSLGKTNEATIAERVLREKAGKADPQPQASIKSGRKRGPVPLWPAARAPQPERSETTPFWVPFLILVAVVALIYLIKRMKPGTVLRRPTVMSQPDAFETTTPGDKGVPFLSELKKREELLEQGIEIIPARRGPRVIDLDAANVREVEDKPQS